MASHEVTKGMFRKFTEETGVMADDWALTGWRKAPPKDSQGYQTRDYPEYSEYGEGPSDRYPMHRVDWHSAAKFCEWLSQREGRRYRLPTEAEWEYACRAGTTTDFWWGDTWIESYVAWRLSRTFPQLALPGSHAMNPWGFYDITGNAWEWCLDYWDGPAGLEDPNKSFYARSPGINPRGPARGTHRIKRGGGINMSRFEGCYSFFRGWELPKERGAGIRLVLEIGDLKISEKEVAAAKVDYAWEATAEQQAAVAQPQRTLVLPLAGGAEMELVWVPAGQFAMGVKIDRDAPLPFVTGDGGYSSSTESPQTRVRFEHGFFIGRTEVTQAQYQAVMKTNPSRHRGPDKPVHDVDYNASREFFAKLTRAMRALGVIPVHATLRAPNEAEWEYACRAGSETRYSFGDDEGELYRYAWYDHIGGPGPVARKLPNAWGLYDMHGNVAERVNSWRRRYLGGETTPIHPSGVGLSSRTRGGSWAVRGHRCRSAARDFLASEAAFSFIGLRVMLDEREIESE